MIRRWGIWMCEAAARLLPPERGDWADAMRGEVRHIDGGGAALVFGFGCLLASLRTWVARPEGRSLLARWTVAGATLAFAIFHLGCALHGMRIVLGAPDPYHLALAGGGAAEQALAAAYRDVTPAAAGLLLTLGLAHVGVALSLMVWRKTIFAASSLAALVAATMLGFLILSATGSLRGVAIQFMALAFQALVLPLFVRPSASPMR